ncbi:hypothetical protein SVIOM342S_07462 [Streptomyces violaceorubidus]
MDTSKTLCPVARSRSSAVSRRGSTAARSPYPVPCMAGPSARSVTAPSEARTQARSLFMLFQVRYPDAVTATILWPAGKAGAAATAAGRAGGAAAAGSAGRAAPTVAARATAAATASRPRTGRACDKAVILPGVRRTTRRG